MTDKLGRVTLGNGKVLEAEHVLLTAPPSVWNKIAIDPVLPAALAPQMGTNIKYLMSLKSPVWRRTELGPELLSDGPVSMTWHATDGQKGAGEAMVAFSGGPPADACREWTATRAGSQLPRRTEQGLSRHHRELRPGAVHGLAVGSLDEGLVLVPGAGTGHLAGTDAPQRHRPAALRRRVHLLRVRRLHGGRLNSGAAMAKRIAERDGMVKKTAA